MHHIKLFSNFHFHHNAPDMIPGLFFLPKNGMGVSLRVRLTPAVRFPAKPKELENG